MPALPRFAQFAREWLHGPEQVFTRKALPSGRLGVGGMKNVAWVASASRGFVVARRRARPSVMVSANSGSSTGGSPALTFATFSGSISTPSTSKPRLAREAAIQAPSLPRPKTETDWRFIGWIEERRPFSAVMLRGQDGDHAPDSRAKHRRVSWFAAGVYPAKARSSLGTPSRAGCA